jgi:hypothetical protein
LSVLTNRVFAYPQREKDICEIVDPNYIIRAQQISSSGFGGVGLGWANWHSLHRPVIRLRQR